MKVNFTIKNLNVQASSTYERRGSKMSWRNKPRPSGPDKNQRKVTGQKEYGVK